MGRDHAVRLWKNLLHPVQAEGEADEPDHNRDWRPNTSRSNYFLPSCTGWGNRDSGRWSRETESGAWLRNRKLRDLRGICG